MLFLHRPGSVVVYFRLIFDQPMGEETSTSYLQQAAKAGVLGDVNADSIPGKPRVTLEDGRVCPPGLIVAHALLKLSKTKKMS